MDAPLGAPNANGKGSWRGAPQAGKRREHAAITCPPMQGTYVVLLPNSRPELNHERMRQRQAWLPRSPAVHYTLGLRNVRLAESSPGPWSQIRFGCNCKVSSSCGRSWKLSKVCSQGLLRLET